MEETVSVGNHKVRNFVVVFIIVILSAVVLYYLDVFTFNKQKSDTVVQSTAPLTAEQIKEQLNDLKENQNSASKLSLQDIQKQLNTLASSTKNKSTVSSQDIRNQLEALNASR